MIVLKGVSVICTVYNEERTIDTFLRSLLGMTSLPEEIVIIDGGSSDRTFSKLESWAKASPILLRIWREPTFNRAHHRGPVARARNEAIRRSKGSIIAVTDAGCRVEPDWLFHLTAPMLESATTMWTGGWYSAEATTWVSALVARVWMMPVARVSAQSSQPSSRSLAFRKDAWEKVGGYPEEHIWAEDTVLAIRLNDAFGPMVFAPRALVHYTFDVSYGRFLALAFRYATGDGFYGARWASLWKNAAKIAVFISLVGLALLFSSWVWLAVCLWVWFLVFRADVQSGLTVWNILLLPVFGITKFLADASFLVGYAVGALQRWGRRGG